MHLNLNNPEDKALLHQLLAQDAAFAPLRRTLYQVAEQAQEQVTLSA